MSLLDLLIIYLSLGAPFGAYYLVRTRKPTGFADVGAALLAFLFWPVYAVRSGVKHFRSAGDINVFETYTELDVELDGLRQRFSSATDGSNRLVVNRVGTALDRYCELSLASITRSGNRNRQYLELLTVSGNPSADLGSVCLERRNRIIINRHLDNARNDLTNELANLPAQSSPALLIVQEIALLFADEFLQGTISSKLESSDRSNLPAWRTSSSTSSY